MFMPVINGSYHFSMRSIYGGTKMLDGCYCIRWQNNFSHCNSIWLKEVMNYLKKEMGHIQTLKGTVPQMKIMKILSLLIPILMGSFLVRKTMLQHSSK